MAQSPPPLSRLDLARLRLGELDEAEAARVEAAIAEDPRLAAAYAETSQNMESFASIADKARGDFAAALAAEETRAGERRAAATRVASQRPGAPRSPGRWRWLALVAPTVAVAAGLVIGFIAVFSRTGPTGGASGAHPGGASHVDFRGTVALKVFAQRAGGGEQVQVQKGTRLRGGDSLRFSITCATAGYLDLFSLDSRGTLSPFYPDKSAAERHAPLAILRPGKRELPGSVELDDSPGEERLVLIFSRTAFDRRRVQRAVRSMLERGEKLSAVKLGLYSGIVQLRTLEKATTP